MAVSKRRSGGFTLVELLVVVVIIGMLVGLLMPAILNARRSSQQTKCLNNLKEINKATMLFETSKKRLPGSISYGTDSTGAQRQVWTWAIELLDPIGRTDIAETWRKPSVKGETPLIGTFRCTEDTDATTVASNASSSAALSYVANAYFFRPRQYQNGAPTSTTKSVTMSDIKSPSISILFSERVNTTPPTPANLMPSPWAPMTVNDDSRVTFPGRDTSIWGPLPTGTEKTLDSMGTAALISSNHPGVVLVSLADDSATALSTRTDMSIYRRAHQ